MEVIHHITDGTSIPVPAWTLSASFLSVLDTEAMAVGSQYKCKLDFDKVASVATGSPW